MTIVANKSIISTIETGKNKGIQIQTRLRYQQPKMFIPFMLAFLSQQLLTALILTTLLWTVFYLQKINANSAILYYRSTSVRAFVV